MKSLKIADRSIGARKIRGEIISDKMEKTRSVVVRCLVKHPIYGKYVWRSKKILAHDEKNESRTGDVVEIGSTSPISKRKSWVVINIVRRFAAADDVAVSEEGIVS